MVKLPKLDFYAATCQDNEWNKVPEERGAGRDGIQNGSGSTSSGREEEAGWLDLKSVVCQKPFQVLLIRSSEAVGLTSPWISPPLSPSLGKCLVLGIQTLLFLLTGTASPLQQTQRDS